MLAVLLSLVTGTKAQFSLNTVEESAKLKVPMKIYQVPLKADVINDAKARMIRKALWRQRNLVDTKISFTGSTTQFNDAWSSNGGQNVISGFLSGYYYHNYDRKRFSFTFRFDANYGVNFIDDTWFKNQDYFKIYDNAKWKIKTEGALRNWAYSFESSFESQFSTGYESRASKAKDIVWSNFMAPGKLNGGIGLTYTSPNPKLPFVITISPASGTVLFVTDDRIPPGRRQNLGIPVTTTPIYGEDGTTIIGYDYDYKNFKAEGGSNFRLTFNRVFKFGKKQGISLQYNTDLSSFYGWITQVSRHALPNTTPPQALLPTVNWTNAINFNPIKFLTFQFSTRTVYDRSQIDKVQMQYFLSVGLSYSYKNK